LDRVGRLRGQSLNPNNVDMEYIILQRLHPMNRTNELHANAPNT